MRHLPLESANFHRRRTVSGSVDARRVIHVSMQAVRRESARMNDRTGGEMWLEHLAWFASVVSALAIVVSAIYASMQIRHNTRAVRAAAFQQVVNSFAQISSTSPKTRNSWTYTCAQVETSAR